MPLSLALLFLASLAQPPRLPSFRSDSELSAYLRARIASRTCTGATLASDSALAPATDSVAVIGGHVMDADGDPLGAALIQVGGLPGATVASADGSFGVVIPYSRLRTGDSLTMTARRLGYQPLRYRFAIHSGHSLALTMSLCPATTELEAVAVTAAQSAPAYDRASITNTQHAGVDEGDIVKLHGDQLVVLRRGRLFTVSIGDDRLSPQKGVNAFGADIDPRDTWYDELLVSGDQVVVIGYSYQRGGTEVGLFHIDSRGRITHRSTYQLRSNDYYSSRNYASRLIGSTLVFYSPLYVPDNVEDPLAALPAMRRYREGSGEGDFQRIATVQRIYRPARDWNRTEGVALHTVTTCPLGDGEMSCQSTVVVGPRQRTFYVSPTAVYVWTAATLYRMPLDGGAPSSIGVTGQPVDQFSFLESGDGYLNVLLHPGAHPYDGVSLLRVALRDLGDGSQTVPRWRYRPLPDAGDADFQNRFVGDYVLYGTGNGWGTPDVDRSTLTVVPWRGGDLTQIPLDHATDRIEVMGRDAIVIGSRGVDLRASGIHLDAAPRAEQSLTIPDASQGELRSHGFFYRPDGIIGLPIREGDSPRYAHLLRGSAGVMFLRNDGHQFTQLGLLVAGQTRDENDDCKASCVDWYGNARPLFVDDRVFALLGYELIEGSIGWDTIQEVQRVTFAPRRTTVAKD